MRRRRRAGRVSHLASLASQPSPAGLPSPARPGAKLPELNSPIGGAASALLQGCRRQADDLPTVAWHSKVKFGSWSPPGAPERRSDSDLRRLFFLIPLYSPGPGMATGAAQGMPSLPFGDIGRPRKQHTQCHPDGSGHAQASTPEFSVRSTCCSGWRRDIRVVVRASDAQKKWMSGKAVLGGGQS